MIDSQNILEKRQVRGSCYGSRSKGKRGKFDLSRDKINPQRETDVQRFLLTAPCFLPTVHIVFLKVDPWIEFFCN